MKKRNLRFLTWNLSWAYGLGSEGTSVAGQAYRTKPREHFENVLQAMGDLIGRLNIDVAFLQEVDFNASRSHHINQLDFLSRRSNLLYRNSAVSWNSPYVPYPGLNPLHHFGLVRSGGAILSRYPLSLVNLDLLPKPPENPRLYNFFYLHRYLQVCQIRFDDRESPLNLMNLHLEAFSKDNRELHLMRLSERLADYEIDVAGGDFNGPMALTETATKGWEPLPYTGATFPANHPEQALDGFVVRKAGWKLSEVEVLDAGDLSDHRPLLVEIGGM
jgi:endonuclease/exonuclease/phosphatase family metal-dependent hydrolase